MKTLVIFLFIVNLTVTLVYGSFKLQRPVIQGINERKPYIIYMGELSPGVERLATEDHHHNLLTEVVGAESIAREARIHSYGRSFNGFVAKLLPHEANLLKEKRNVVSVFPNKVKKLLTTRSWDFLGMRENSTPRNLHVESDTIVGLLDTGIYADAPSFNDEGYGPPPLKWKGKCEMGQNFTGCNRKVIGARYCNLLEDDDSVPTPADLEGHGTHTASTAAGRSVNGASLYGLAKGTARGGVPSARIATYKVCGDLGCSDMSLLAGFDHAIADGVDIISVSIGGPPEDFWEDPIAIGSFHAMKKGILTACAGGNDGPDAGTVSNIAPWILTVAATNMYQKFETLVQLGNGFKFQGVSINTFQPKKKMYPLISAQKAYNGTGGLFSNASVCDASTLAKSKVKGKIVLCFGDPLADESVKETPAAGTIMSVEVAHDDTAFNTVLPATVVPPKIGNIIDHYINTTRSPQAIIHKTKAVATTAPIVASFSSRGPQTVAKHILKPDISAPGIDILAGYSKLVSITDTDNDIDNRYDYFNIMSGTSMATPHVAGAAAYVKTHHPNWSPAAIKSALMTTAKPVDSTGSEDPLSTGSGLLSPIDAIDPGLLYDLTANDYIRYLCKEGYNGSTLNHLHDNDKNHRFNCSKFKPGHGVDGLNYPSLHLHLLPCNTQLRKVFQRTVTHVGDGAAVYKAKVTAPKGFSIKVIPDVLTFAKPNENKSFHVVVTGAVTDDTPNSLTGFLEWNDNSNKHRVRSPILIYKPTVTY